MTGSPATGAGAGAGAAGGVGASGGAGDSSGAAASGQRGGLHHVELWVADLAAASACWLPLLTALGYVEHARWQHGVSYLHGGTYLVLEQSPALTAGSHERTRPGLNHLAFRAGSRADVDALTATAQRTGWQLLFADRHPYAGGPQQYAAYLADPAGFEVELVADE